ncbi:MAG: fibronectin type III domain-containing protein [Bacteroidetes bacterium]|nr:fibronectin type III domain-containing protein [Bacteroidota bacterium]
MKRALSIPLLLLFCKLSVACTYTIALFDSDGDGWNGNTVSVIVGEDTVLSEVTIPDGLDSLSFTFEVYDSAFVLVDYTAGGSWPWENEYTVYNHWDMVVVEVESPGMSAPSDTSFVALCSLLQTTQLIYPIEGFINGRPYTAFFCTSVISAQLYHFQYSRDSLFFSDTVDMISTSMHSDYSDLMYFGTKYYVRVRTENDSLISAWSDVRSFYISAAPTYYDVTPHNGCGNVLLDTAINIIIGNTYGFDFDFQLEFDASPSMNSPSYLFFSSDSTYFPLPCLNFSTQYYHHFKMITSIDTSDWTINSYFITSHTISIISPNSCDPPEQVSLKFRIMKTPCAEKYEIALDTSSSFTCPVIYELYDSVPADYVQIGNLEFGAHYYWRARAMHSADTSEWSPYLDFCTLSKPSLYWPSDGMAVNTPDVWLNVQAVIGATGYIFETDTASDFTSPAYTYSSDPSHVIQINDLLFGQTYYWRAKAFNSADTSLWSDTWHFSVSDINICLHSPADASVNLPPKVKLSAVVVSGVNLYQYRLSEDSLFSPVNTVSLEHSSSYGYVLSPYLDFGVTYYWRARVCHTADTSVWSEIWSFDVVDSLMLLSPFDGTTNISVNPALSWQYWQYLSGYEVLLDTTYGFTDPAVFTTASYQNMLNLSGLEPMTTYYWKVRAFHPNDTSLWTAVWHFTTEEGVNTRSDLNDNRVDCYIKVYPNPSKGRITIETTLPAGKNGKVMVLGVTGALKREYLLHRGLNRFTFETAGWAKEAYVCSLVVEGKAVGSRKVVVE